MVPKGKLCFASVKILRGLARTLNVTPQPIAGHAEGVMHEEEVDIVDGDELVRQQTRLRATCLLPVLFKGLFAWGAGRRRG